MKTYTKQITVQAVQWTGENLEEVTKLCHDNGYYDCEVDETHLFVNCEPDGLTFAPGDYLVFYTDLEYLTRQTNEDFQRDYKEVTP